MGKKFLSELYVLLAACTLMSCQLSGQNRQTGDSVSNASITEQVEKTHADSSDAANPVCGLPQVAKGTPEVVLRRYAYTVSFNPENKIPNWVAWELTAGHANGPYKRGGIQFQEDEGVTTYDYMRSGYDRGHMCPSGDNKWSQKAQEESFLMTNICPQDHNLNAGDWNEMEIQCRKWAEQYGKVDIMAGPILFRGKHKKIGKKVVVPDAFFKVVYIPSLHQAVGFIYRNKPGNRPKGDYVNSIDEIERITGIHFLPAIQRESLQQLNHSPSDLSAIL